MVDYLPPPEGLNLAEIESEGGLLVAIKREAERLDASKKEGLRLTRDQIRLISFLAGEVRRRIENLSPEQKVELDRIRTEAREREMEERVSEVADAVESFVSSINEPGGEIRFSRITELEDMVHAMEANLGGSPEKYAEFLNRMADLTQKLDGVKKKGTLFGGLQDFG